LVVAVDGPSGAGKSTVSRRLAQRLNARYLDTGAMYRGATVRVLRAGVDLADSAAIAALVAGLRVEPGLDPKKPTICIDDEDLSREVRTAAVTQAVSAVSAIPEVRAVLVRVQRAALDQESAIVVEGRDIGTVVAPDATVKVFLTAAPDARAERRNLELRSSPEADSLPGTAADLARRDAIDSGRAVSPLSKAGDAVEIDTTTMSADDAVETILALIWSRTGEGTPH
jgi:cytidylate kinase